MRHVLLIDDVDSVRVSLKQSLEEWDQLKVTTAATVKEAVKLFRAPPDPGGWDAAVVDLLLKPVAGGHPELGEFASIQPNGYGLAQLFRQERRNRPVFGLTQEIENIAKTVQNWFKTAGDPTGDIGVYNKKTQWVLLRHHILKLAGQPPRVKVFIVHGHDASNTKDELVRFVTDNLKWPQPVILQDAKKSGKTWIDLFEEHASLSAMAWILFTPDEWGCPIVRPEKGAEQRPRPNVSFECGYFMGAFGRQSNRILLFEKGNVVLPSDLTGIAQSVRLKGPVTEHENEIRRELAPWL
jgi:predicted nucleotide-binding protein